MLSTEEHPWSKPLQINTREAACLFILCLAAGALLSHMLDILPPSVTLLPTVTVEETSKNAAIGSQSWLSGTTSNSSISLHVVHSNVASPIPSSTPSVMDTASGSLARNAAEGEKNYREEVRRSNPDDCLGKDLYDLVDTTEAEAQPSPGPSSYGHNETTTGSRGGNSSSPVFGYVRLIGNDFSAIPLNSRTCFTMTGTHM